MCYWEHLEEPIWEHIENNGKKLKMIFLSLSVGYIDKGYIISVENRDKVYRI
jgi:hypothetical protein